MKDWDQELDILASDLDSLIGERHQRMSKKSLEANKVRIVQMQVNIDRKIERIRRVLARDLLLLPREQALLHWSGVFCDGVRRWMPRASELNAKKLWLHLIKLRMGSDNTGAKQLLPSDLVELAARQGELRKTEDMLTQSIIDLDRERRILHERYGRLEIAQANAEGSGSLQARLGETFDDAIRSPLMRSLTDVFDSLCSKPTKDIGYRKLDQMDRRTNSLMNLARHMINGWTRGRTVPPKSKERFQNMLEQLNDLESETRAALAPEIPPPAQATLKSVDQRVQNP